MLENTGFRLEAGFLGGLLTCVAGVVPMHGAAAARRVAG